MMKRTTRRYYKEGETCFVKSENIVGVVKKLDIDPKNNIYKAVVETIRKEGEETVVKTKTYNLWELDIDKTDYFKKQRQFQEEDLLFSKTKKTARIPSKRDEDGAYDIYACFEEDELLIPKVSFSEDEDYIFSENHPLVPTGIASCVSEKWRINLKNERGSVGKYKVLVLSGLIDSGYRGEWFVNLAPLTKDLLISKTYDFPKKEDGTPKPVELKDLIIYPYDLAIAQAKVEYSPKLTVKEIPYDKLKKIKSKRGMGALGSSNK